MSQSTVRLTPSPTKKIVVALLIAAVAAGGIVFWWSSGHRSEQGAGPSEGTAFPWGSAASAKPADPLANLNLTPAEADRQQRAAAEAAARQLGAAELTGPVKERPEFVSQLEWTVLQQASQRAPDPAKELTRLVNTLRFMKHLEEWRNLAGAADAKQRQALATQLLASVPARVTAGDMSKADAQQLQGQLLADLVADPTERSRRAEEESRRLVEPPQPQAQQAQQAG